MEPEKFLTHSEFNALLKAAKDDRADTEKDAAHHDSEDDQEVARAVVTGHTIALAHSYPLLGPSGAAPISLR